MPRLIELPPVPITDAKVADAAAAYARLVDENATVAARLAELENDRPAAVEADRRAYADAIRAGKADPGTKAVERLDADLTATRRRSEALAVAVAAAQEELVSTVEARRAAWGAEIDRRVAKDRAEVSKAVEALGAARDKLSESLSLAGWLSRFPLKTAWMPPSALAHVPGLTSPNGDPHPWPVVLAALRRYGEPPAPRPPVAQRVAEVAA